MLDLKCSIFKNPNILGDYGQLYIQASATEIHRMYYFQSPVP